MSQKQAKTRVKFPIGIKLVVIISVLLLISLGIVISLVSYISTENVKLTAEASNLTINQQAGEQVQSAFQSVHAAVIMYLRMADRLSGDTTETQLEFFDFNQSIAAISITQGGRASYIYNDKFLLSNKLTGDTIRRYFDRVSAASASVTEGMAIFNAAQFFELSMLCAVLNRADTGAQTVKVLFMPDNLSETFGIGTNTSFLVNNSGAVLLHPSNDYVLEGADFSDMQIVKEALQDSSSQGRQIAFEDNEGKRYFGAYIPIGGTDTIVITTIPHDVVFEAVRSVTRQNRLLALMVLCMAILFIWFFSKTISGPVRILASAALEIENGNFEQKLKPQSNDEIGLLTESFGKMTRALNIFGRFVNKEIALKAMRGQIKPGGLPKHATIFFSDIRGFTEKSENFTKKFKDDASDRIVLWLNEYFTYMVDCVEKTGGVVDKFIGDAVMAHWGTASSAGSPEKDAFNGVKAALMMRNALHELNQRRKKDDPGNPEINMGCGLNTGIVTAGQLGSVQRMEYTVIGDPVNLASRTESLNKPLGTDILITEDTWNLVGDKFITEEMPPVTVKGKEKPVRMFAVVNLKDAAGPQTLAEVRKLLGIDPPDVSKVDTNAEEKKYKIEKG
ncbi:MAG: HAMP domain-containing protein [Treponema sp.]|nr:HAMP domain-containing protein [Treponema sp.]